MASTSSHYVFNPHFSIIPKYQNTEVVHDIAVIQTLLAKSIDYESDSTEISPKNTEVVHGNADLQTVSAKSIDSESDYPEIIEYSPYFGPYKSILERVIAKEVSKIAKEYQHFERKRKRVLALT
ncbi:hypothetical protein Lser_V15G44604 [Lactuca serriola]